MRNMRRISLALASLGAVVPFHGAFAAAIESAQAKAAAEAWLVRGGAPAELAGRTVDAVEALGDDAAKMYVANVSGGGYVVLSTDDRIDPVIAFAASGEIAADARNPLWALLTADLACRAAATATDTASGIALLAASPRTAAQQRWDELLGASGKKLMSAPSVSDPRVDSLVQTRWDQLTVGGKNVYNYYTPNNYYCGCVATATAQIMKYFTYPTAAVSNPTYTCQVDGKSRECPMKGGTYDWANMPLVPNGNITDAQAQAIGKLTYDIGCSIGINWTSSGSGGSIYSARLSLLNQFGYKSCEGVVFTDGYSSNGYPYSLDRCKQIVIPCLDYGTPVEMSVKSVKGDDGHAVVVDGYGYVGSDFYMHVNCGWGGSSDAWYCPPDLTMGPYNFNAINGFIYQILPQATGTIVSGRVLDAGGSPIANATVTLKSGSLTKGSTASDARGIYALLAPKAGAYTLVATASGSSATLGITVVANNSRQMAEGGMFYSQASYAPTLGNTYGNELRITGIAGAAEPVFSPESCTFYPSTNVTLTCATEGAVIRYTTDGSDPTEASAVYTGPITVIDDTTIRARAYKSGMNASAVVAAIYTYDVLQGGPKGDYYVKPILISGAQGSYTIDDNTDYTLEPNEAKHTLQNNSYAYQYRTSWYKWTAPGSGTVTFTTKFTAPRYNLPSAVAVYPDGESVPTSVTTRLAMSKDYTSSGDYTTSVSLSVTQGTTYRIVGIPTYDMGGTFTLSWSGELTVAASETSTTGDVPVPYAWLDAFYPGRGTSADSYESLGNALGANGLTVWQSYLAGLVPTNETSQIQATIRLEGGRPVVTWSPMSAVSEELGYAYRVKGKQNLGDATWAATNSASRFFKVFLEKK